jgi:hypothetical protein
LPCGAQLDESLKDRITLLPDDYLQGLISLINEQVRTICAVCVPAFLEI